MTSVNWLKDICLKCGQENGVATIAKKLITHILKTQCEHQVFHLNPEPRSSGKCMIWTQFHIGLIQLLPVHDDASKSVKIIKCLMVRFPYTINYANTLDHLYIVKPCSCWSHAILCNHDILASPSQTNLEVNSNKITYTSCRFTLKRAFCTCMMV